MKYRDTEYAGRLCVVAVDVRDCFIELCTKSQAWRCVPVAHYGRWQYVVMGPGVLSHDIASTS